MQGPRSWRPSASLLARKIDDSRTIAHVTGTSVGKAKAVVATGKVLGACEDLAAALQHGDISLDQAAEIATAEESAPRAARGLVAVAQEQPFRVLKDKARKTKLEAEQHRGLARSGRGGIRCCAEYRLPQSELSKKIGRGVWDLA